MVLTAIITTITTLGCLTFRRENGLSSNALGPFRLPVPVMLPCLSTMLCMSLVGAPRRKVIWMVCMPFSCQVSDLALLNCYLVHIRNAAQRWFKLRNVGPSPRRRSDHAMASDGTRVFVLGGYSEDAQSDVISHIHVFDTSMYFRSVISS